MQQQQVGPAVLPQQLAAASAGHQPLAVAVHTGDGDQPAAAGRVQRRDQPALGAQPDAVRGVLDVAPDDHPAVVDQPGGPDREVGVRRVGGGHDLGGRSLQRRPVDSPSSGGSRPSSVGWPSAAGIRSRCDANASTNRVVT